MKKILMLSAAAFVLGTPMAFAADAPAADATVTPPVAAKDAPAKDVVPTHHRGEMMEKIDTDKDGAISKAEFMAFHEKRFDEMDTNHDGKITKEEGEAKHAEWKKKGKDAVKGSDAPADAPAK